MGWLLRSAITMKRGANTNGRGVGLSNWVADGRAAGYLSARLIDIIHCQDRKSEAVTMKARVKWIEGVTFLGETESGHAIVMDGAPEAGGRNLGARPMETVLIGTAGCTSFDVVHILKKARQQITDCVAEISAERANADPKVFTKIHLHFIVTGKNLNSAQVERAISLSAEKYCSASIMLRKTVAITHDFEVRES
jgi:putative redox protein